MSTGLSELKIHPAAEAFPLLAGDELDDLVEDIRRNGQVEPIVFVGGQLLDGRNRVVACERLGIRPPTRRVPRRVAYAGGGLCELAWNALRLAGEPPMTRFVASQLASDHSYDLGPAERDFGYRERVPLREANERLVASLRPDADSA